MPSHVLWGHGRSAVLCTNCSSLERSLAGRRSSLQTLALVQFASARLRVEEVRYRISPLIERSLIGERGCVAVRVYICVGVRYGKRGKGARKQEQGKRRLVWNLVERGEGSLSVWCAHTESTCSRERLTNKLVRNKATLSIRYLANTHRNRRKYTYNLVRRRAAAHQTLQLALGMLDGLLRGLSRDDGRAWSVCVRERNRDEEKLYWLL